MLEDAGWVLVSGGAGFIGGHIAERLLDEGERVRVLDNFSTGSRETVEALASKGGARFEVAECSLVDAAAVSEAMNGVTHVVHQAALPSVQRSIEDPVSSHEVNTTGTLHLLQAAKERRVRRFVFAGSSSVYGDQGELPKRESMAPRPKSPYALGKQMGEAYCSLFHELYGTPTMTLRYFNVFGPRQNPDSQYAAVIPLFISALLSGEPPQIYGDGRQTRDFTYVSNVVDANMLALQGKGSDGAVMNVACGSRTSLLELLDDLRSIMETDLEPIFQPPRQGDVRDSQAAIEEAERNLGFVPRIGLREGLERTVAWFKDPRKGTA